MLGERSAALVGTTLLVGCHHPCAHGGEDCPFWLWIVHPTAAEGGW